MRLSPGILSAIKKTKHHFTMLEITFKFETRKELDDFILLISTNGLKRGKCKECGVLHTRSSEFCSEKCYNRWYHREEYRPNECAKPLPEKKCKECGRKFFAKNIRAEYCSRRCNQATYRRNKRFSRKQRLDVVVTNTRVSTFESARRHLASLPKITPIKRPGYSESFQ
jgi:hypothetical protein